LKKIGLHACSKYEPVVMEGEGTIWPFNEYESLDHFDNE
jgi:hypothetical protein